MSQPNPSKDKPVTEVSAEQYSGTSPSEPAKQRVEVDSPSGDIKVLKVKEGPVTGLDKIKAYYHTVITIIGALVVFINEVTSVTSQFSPDVQHTVTAVVLFLTALLNMLKSNEVWVNKL